MPITTTQFDTANKTIQELLISVQQLAVFIQQVYPLISNNWGVASVPGVKLETTLSAADQAAIQAQYTSLKQKNAAIFAKLP